MKNLIKDIKEDPMHYATLHKEWTKKLKNTYTEADAEVIDYWACRLATLGDTNEINFELDQICEPNKITITIHPDYGS